MGAYGGLFCSAWDEDIGGIFGGQIRCVLNIGFGVAGWQFSQQPPVLWEFWATNLQDRPSHKLWLFWHLNRTNVHQNEPKCPNAPRAARPSMGMRDACTKNHADFHSRHREGPMAACFAVHRGRVGMCHK